MAKQEKPKDMGTNWLDVNCVLFFVFPVLSVIISKYFNVVGGYLKEMFIAVTILLILKSLYWFSKSFNKLKKIDIEKRKRLGKN